MQSEQTLAQQDIVVVAERSEQSSIDRTTYLVRDNAEARASSALDLLGRVPTVDVSPSGSIRLIGRSGVIIQVDGKEVPNAGAFLRALQGSEVAKIEVVTNPSAQFSARGTGGIINIVTRRSGTAGLGGSAMASMGSFGSYEGRVSPSWNRGKLSLNGSVGVRREGSEYELEDERSGPAPGAQANRIERQRSRGDTERLNASLRAAVEIDPRQTISLHAMMMESEGRTSAESDIIDGGSAFEERSQSIADGRLRSIMVDYRREGSRPGGQTSLSASHMSIRLGTEKRFIADGSDGPDAFRLRTEGLGAISILKADHVQPAGEQRLLIGGQIEQQVENSRQEVSVISPSKEPITADDEFEGRWSEAAAYVTYELHLWGNKLLAGMRSESRWHDIDGIGHEPAARTHIFPSLHIERKLGERLTANLSYSSRIGWPGLASLDPRLRFQDPATARAGNPLLRPEKTHSVELKLMATAGRHGADFTAYVQQTRDLRTEFARLEGEVLVSRPVNLGTRMSLGTSLVVRGPLAKGLRYTVTADLALDRVGDARLADVDEGGTRHGASVQLDYRSGIEGRAGADHVRLAARYSGPNETGLSRLSSMSRAEASWSHAVSDRLAAVLTASHAFKPAAIVTRGPDVIVRTTSRAEGPSINLALTYSLNPSGR